MTTFFAPELYRLEIAIILTLKKVGIPKIADFPAINCFTKKDIEHFNSITDKVEINGRKADDRNEDFNEVQEMLTKTRDSLRYCKDNNLEMIIFTH